MVERIRKLCKERNTSIAKLEKELGFGNGTIGKWSKFKPTHERLQMVADILGVPVSYLTGESEQKEKPTVKDDGRSGMSDARRQLYEAVDDLTDEQCIKLLGIILEAKKIL